MENDNYTIKDLKQFTELWSKTYNAEGRPDWSHILPFYSEKIYFRDSIQEIHGFDGFKTMVERLTNRSGELKMKILKAVMGNETIFIEWEMTILFRKTRSSTLFGSSRLTLDDNGKIIEQRDYYDLWGDIFDNVSLIKKPYRTFMRRVFG